MSSNPDNRYVGRNPYLTAKGMKKIHPDARPASCTDWPLLSCWISSFMSTDICCQKMSCTLILVLVNNSLLGRAFAGRRKGPLTA